LFKGGCQVALGDVNGDGVPDIITGPGPGGNAALRTNSIKVFDGNNGTILAGPFDNLQPFGATFKKGYWISAGDFNGDDQADIVLSARGGFAPTVRVIDGATGGMLFEVTTAFPATYKKGVRTAVADVTDDGTPDIVMASGAKTTSLVKVFDGSALTLVGGGLEFNPFGDLPTVKSGVFVAAGDVNGDGNADIITGVMKGAPALRVFDGLTGQKIGELIPAEGPLYKGGIRVGSFDVDSDGDMDIITSTGKAKGVFAHVRTLDGQTLNEIDNFFAQQANIFKGGVFVAGGR
jgi:hypothetical protein